LIDILRLIFLGNFLLEGRVLRRADFIEEEKSLSLRSVTDFSYEALHFLQSVGAGDQGVSARLVRHNAAAKARRSGAPRAEPAERSAPLSPVGAIA
jgi:hypothetical protein